MKPFLTPVLALTGLTAALTAHAASTVDLSVTGLITPSACEPGLSNGGIYDLGKIAAKDLNVDQPTHLPTHTLHLSIICEATTLLALAPRDNRLGSNSDSGDQAFRFGLGLINDTIKLGHLSLSLASIVADGAGRYPIGSTAPDTWAPTNLLSHYYLSSFSLSPNSLTPAPLQQLNADLHLAPTIAPSNTLPLAEEMPIDGSVTLSIHYL